MMCPTISKMHFKYQERFILIPLIILMRDQSHYLLKYVSVQLGSFSALTGAQVVALSMCVCDF